MSQEFNVIEAKFSSRDRKCVIGPLWQYDYGQILRITGIDLPENYEVHFSNDPRGVAKRIHGNVDGVRIPAEYLKSGSSIFAWLYLHHSEDDGSTKFQIEIQVRRRAKPIDYVPETEDDKSYLSQLVDGKVKTAIQEVTKSVNENADSIKKLDEKISKIGGTASLEYDENTLAVDDGVMSVKTATEVIEDDPRPITSGAVYDEFSKAVALLKTI